jgi:hypothetical protein
VRAVIKELRLQQPPVRMESVTIDVYAKIYQRGETWKFLVHDVGTTIYNGYEDQIRYKRP